MGLSSMDKLSVINGYFKLSDEVIVIAQIPAY